MIWNTKTHRFTATICHRTGTACPAMARTGRELAKSILASGRSATRDIEIEGSVELAYCKNGCTAKFRARVDEVRLYCGVETDAQMDLLDTFAELMFGTDFGILPSSATYNPPCAMLQALTISEIDVAEPDFCAIL